MKTIIIEDVPNELELLKSYLEKYCPQIEVVGQTGNISEAIQLIEYHQPELLFLDVEIMEGVTSFNLLDQLQKRGVPFNFEIIFMTGHKQFDYPTAAFSYSALDFLVKPIDPVLLKKAVDKALQRNNPQQYVQQLNLFLDLVRSSDHKNRRIAVHLTRGIIEFVEVDLISHLVADSVITTFHMTNQAPLKAIKNLGQYVQILSSDQRFVSISHSALINVDQLKRYNKERAEAEMKDGSILKASRRDGKELKAYIDRHPDEMKNTLTASFVSLIKGLFKR